MSEVNWSMLAGLGDTYNKAYTEGQFGKIADNLDSGLNPDGSTVAPAVPLSSLGGGPAAAASAAPAPTMKMPADPAIEARFVSTLRQGGLTNPFGLAAMAAYGHAESGYSPSNVTGSWSDPSQSGQPGTSGGTLSWRGPRFAAMQQATAGATDPVSAQAKFALVENPDLTVALQNAKSADEANALMANAWKFAGYDQPGGEFARRQALTNAYVGRLASLTGGGAGAAAAADAPARTASVQVLPPGRPADLPSVTGGTPSSPAPTLADVAPTPSPAAAPLANFPLLAGASPVVPARLVGSRPALGDVDATGSVAPASPPAEAPTAGSGLVPSATRPAAGIVPPIASGVAGAPPAAATATAVAALAAPAKVDMSGDFPVLMKDGKLWTVAQAAASKDDNSPYDEDVEKAQEAARVKAGLNEDGTPKTSGASAASPATDTPAAIPTDGHGPGTPGTAATGSGLPPPPPAPVATQQARSMIALMLRDPSTRAAGMQALGNLSTRAANPPTLYNGALVQYDKDGQLRQVIAAKDLPDSVRQYQFYAGQEKAAGRTPLSFVGFTDRNQDKGSKDEGAKITAQIKARETDATARGLDLNDPDVRQYVQTGKYPGSENDARVLHPNDALYNRKGQELARNAAAGAGMPDQTADFLAERVLAGDPKALIGLGRGAQGAENLGKIQGLVAQKAAERGKDASDLLHNAAVAAGMGAEQRTFGTQTARMASASMEAEGAIELGRQASAAVSRTTFVPLNRAIQAVQAGTSDPALKAFVASNNTIINTFARAINPTGASTVSDKEHAREMLSTADGPEAYNAVLDQMQKEIDLAHQAPNRASKMLEDQRQARKAGGQPAPAPSGPDLSKAPRLGSVTMPPEAVGDLRTAPTPANRAWFDYSFGVGASDRILGPAR